MIYEETVTSRREAKLTVERDQAFRERDAALAELKEVKKAIAWTMDKLKMIDLFGTGSGEIPASANGYLPGFAPSEPSTDTDRLEWINQNGRVLLSQSGFMICLPVQGATNEEIPTIYNFRHIVDICRKLN